MVQQCRRGAVAVVLSSVLALAACTPPPDDPQPEPSASDDAGGATEAPTEGAAVDVPLPEVRAVPDLPDATAEQLESVEVELEQISDLTNVTSVAVHPDEPGVLYVTQRKGVVKALLEDGSERRILDWREQTHAGGERGMLGLTFSPDGERMYVYYIGSDEESHLAEWQFADGEVVSRSRREILFVEQPDDPNATVHKGGNIAFARDGSLYLGLGDGGPSDEPPSTAQELDTLLGKLVRIDIAREGDEPYRIPEGNPFVDDPGALPEIYALGLRNPWRWSFDAKTGDMYLADVGRYVVEEVNFVPGDRLAGANFGWHHMEGSSELDGPEPEGHVPPWLEYQHEDRCAVIGGFVYRGAEIPDLHGAYVFGDYCDGKLRAVRNDRGEAIDERELGPELATMSSFGQGLDGELYVTSLDEGVFKLVPAE